MRENSDALNIIEKELQEEIDRYNNELISLLVDDSTQKRTDWIDHEIAMLSLIGRKICVCLELGLSDELHENIASLLESVKKIEYSSDFTPALLSDAIDCILSMMNNSDKEEILKSLINERYCDALSKIENSGLENLEDGQQVVLRLVLSILAWEVNRADFAEKVILESARSCEDSVIPLSTKASVFQTTATILGKRGKEREALNYLNHALVKIRELWHSYMCYSNDNRLLHILFPTQLLFTCSYAIMRQIENNTWKLYERVINYKALASLAGKEQNRILNSGQIDGGLISNIKAIQDRLAAIETEGIFCLPAMHMKLRNRISEH